MVAIEVPKVIVCVLAIINIILSLILIAKHIKG